MAKSKMSVYVRPREQGPAAEEKKVEMKKTEPAKLEEKKAEIKKIEMKKSEAPKESRQVLLSNILTVRPPRHPKPSEDVDDESTSMKNEEAAELQAETTDAAQAGPGFPSPDAPPEMPEVKSDGAEINAGAETVSQSSSPMQASALEPLRVLEAALFMSSQSLQSADLGKLVGIAAVGHVNQLLEELSKQYDSSGSALEVVEENPGKWAMRIRASFAPTVRRFAGEAEIPKHALRTLAYVSRHEGITKRELFKRLGSTIYEDAAELIERGFVTAKPAGRTMALSTTPKFRQYFQG